MGASTCLQLVAGLIAGLIGVAIIKLCQLVSFRHRTLKKLKRGNIKVADRLELFGGHLKSTLHRDDNLETITKLHKQLGETFALFYGPDPWLMTIDLELIRRVFVTEGAKHVNRTRFRTPYAAEVNKSLFQVEGDEWQRTRRLMAPSFAHKQLKSDNVFEEVNRVGDMFMDYIEAHKKPDGGGGGGGGGGIVTDFNHGFKLYSMEVIFRLAFGRAHNERLWPNKRDQLIDLIDEGSVLVISGVVQCGIMFGSLVRRLIGFLSRFTVLGSVIRYLHKIEEDNVKLRRQVRASGNDQHVFHKHDRKVIDSLIESFETGKLDDEHLQANLIFLMLAGFETTANTLTAMFWLLAKNQDKQDILRRELARLGDQSDYLDWVVSETMRLYPAGPLAMGRVIEHDIEHKGMTIERGTSVVPSVWTMHKWHEYWGQDAELYRPERFGEKDQEKFARQFMPFGLGPRGCIGKSLAIHEIKAIATRSLLKYRVELPSGDAGHEPMDVVAPSLVHLIIRKPVALRLVEVDPI